MERPQSHGTAAASRASVAVRALAKLAKSRREIRDYVEEFTLAGGRRIYVLGQGRLINLASSIPVQRSAQESCRGTKISNDSSVRVKGCAVRISIQVNNPATESRRDHCPKTAEKNDSL